MDEDEDDCGEGEEDEEEVVVSESIKSISNTPDVDPFGCVEFCV